MMDMGFWIIISLLAGLLWFDRVICKKEAQEREQRRARGDPLSDYTGDGIPETPWGLALFLVFCLGSAAISLITEAEYILGNIRAFLSWITG